MRHYPAGAATNNRPGCRDVRIGRAVPDGAVRTVDGCPTADGAAAQARPVGLRGHGPPPTQRERPLVYVFRGFRFAALRRRYRCGYGAGSLAVAGATERSTPGAP